MKSPTTASVFLAVSATLTTTTADVMSIRYFRPSFTSISSLAGMSSDEKCAGDPIIQHDIFGTTGLFFPNVESNSSGWISSYSSNASSSTSSGGDGDSSGEDNDDDVQIRDFGDCVNGTAVTCSDETLTASEYDTNTCTGDVARTTSLSHDTRFLTTMSFGCSETDPAYESTYDDFRIMAMYFSDDACSTITGAEEIDFGVIGSEYLEESFGSANGDSSATLAAAPLVDFAANEDGSCNVNEEVVCVSGTLKWAGYMTAGCTGTPYIVSTVPGCLSTSEEGQYVTVSCEEVSDTNLGAHGVVTTQFLTLAIAAVVWVVLASSDHLS